MCGQLKRTATEDYRPWGYYEVLLDEEHYKVKRIVVYPGKRLSLQRHSQRSEHWYVVSGAGLARCGDDEMTVGSGSAVDIPREYLHRIQCTSEEPLVFVEVQQGSYCGEDDIERFEDDFGRS